MKTNTVNQGYPDMRCKSLRTGTKRIAFIIVKRNIFDISVEVNQVLSLFQKKNIYRLPQPCCCFN